MPRRHIPSFELDSTGPEQHPNQATVACGDQQTTLDGDFRERATNRYNPDDADDITSIVVVGGERRVYMADDEDQTCAIIWCEGETPTDCEPSNTQEDAAS